MNKIEIIGEIGLNANGSTDIAMQMIDIAVKNKLDYVKFQKRDINTCYTKEELDVPRESPWGKTNRQQKEGLEFGKVQYDTIDSYCKLVGMPWSASVWDIPSLEFICQYDVPFIKVPSALITDHVLLDCIKQKGKRVIMSVGMSMKDEVDSALNILGSTCDTIMHTTSSYPTPLKELNLWKIRTLQEEYGSDYMIGYSNHFKSPMAVIFAAALGVNVVEFHYTLDRSMYGSDQSASLENRAIEMIVDYLKDCPDAMGDGNWNVMPSETSVMKKLRRWSTLL